LIKALAPWAMRWQYPAGLLKSAVNQCRHVTSPSYASPLRVGNGNNQSQNKGLSESEV